MIVCWTVFGIAAIAAGVGYLGMSIEQRKVDRLYDAAEIEDAPPDSFYLVNSFHFRWEICAERVRFLERKKSGLIVADSFEIVRREQTVYTESPTMSLREARMKWVLATAWLVKLNQNRHDFEWATITAFLTYSIG